VFLDAEHFFDGYRANRDYALEVLRTAAEAGAEVVALCDTNGGMLPGWVAEVVHDVRESMTSAAVHIGIHCHNDTGCAVANTLAAVDAGATHVQGTLNGYGERTGNADLIAVVANLELKLGRRVLPEGRLGEATRIAHAVAEVTNVPPASRQPYVGVSAFAHKAGLHASAIKVDPNLYQHMDPLQVGNDMRMLVSDMAGRASIELKGAELGFALSA
jgi:2-isopropylmalate synthase